MLAQAEPQPERIAWNRTPDALKSEFVLVTLTTGVRIGGSWVAVTPDTFTMNIEKTSNKREIGKGLRTMPRASIADVRSGKRRMRGRVIGTLAGFYGIATIGGIASCTMEAPQGPTRMVAFGGAIAGYFIGRIYDHSTRQVILLPEDLETSTGISTLR